MAVQAGTWERRDSLQSGLRPMRAFLDAPMFPSHRRVELLLDPRTPTLLEPRDVSATPVGRASARRLRSWVRRCTQAIAASSWCSTHEHLRSWWHERSALPAWVGLQPDTPAPGFAAVPKRLSRRPCADLRTSTLVSRVGDAPGPDREPPRTFRPLRRARAARSPDHASPGPATSACRP
jgi:hypothetical protein